MTRANYRSFNCPTVRCGSGMWSARQAEIVSHRQFSTPPTNVNHQSVAWSQQRRKGLEEWQACVKTANNKCVQSIQSYSRFDRNGVLRRGSAAAVGAISLASTCRRSVICISDDSLQEWQKVVPIRRNVFIGAHSASSLFWTERFGATFILKCFNFQCLSIRSIYGFTSLSLGSFPFRN